MVDPSGTFFVYAGQYEPHAVDFLPETESPSYVAVVGKARTYETDKRTYTSIRPKEMTMSNEHIRQRWIVETANRIIDRLQMFTDEPDDQYVRLAREEYGTEIERYRNAVVDALENITTSDD